MTGPAPDCELPADPYDNNGVFYVDADGNIVDNSEVSNEADGWSVTADWAMSDAMAWKFIYSDRSSEYESGLDDDSVAATLFTYPEVGEADQESAELHFFGTWDAWDFVAGLYWFEEEGGNVQDPAIYAGFGYRFVLQQQSESQAMYANLGFNVTDTLRLSAGARYTEDEKNAYTSPIVGLVEDSSTRDWSETSCRRRRKAKFFTYPDQVGVDEAVPTGQVLVVEAILEGDLVQGIARLDTIVARPGRLALWAGQRDGLGRLADLPDRRLVGRRAAPAMNSVAARADNSARIINPRLAGGGRTSLPPGPSRGSSRPRPRPE